MKQALWAHGWQRLQITVIGYTVVRPHYPQYPRLLNLMCLFFLERFDKFVITLRILLALPQWLTNGYNYEKY